MCVLLIYTFRAFVYRCLGADIHTQHGRHVGRGHVAATPVDQEDSEDIVRQQTDVHHRGSPAADHQAEEMRFPGRDTVADRPDVHV